MNQKYSFKKKLFGIYFSLFLFSLGIVLFCVGYFSIQLYKNKAMDLIENNFYSFQDSLMYTDREGDIGIGKTLESMRNAGTINSYLVIHKDVILSKSPDSYKCEKAKYTILNKEYFKNSLFDSKIYLAFYSNSSYVCFRKYFYNKAPTYENQKIGSIQISVPVSSKDFNEIFVIVTIIIFIFIFVYIFAYIFLKRDWIIQSNSTMFYHEVLKPVDIIENRLKYDKNLNRTEMIDFIQSMKNLVKYTSKKYVYNEDEKLNKVFFNIKNVIETCFFISKKFDDLKLKFNIDIQNENLSVEMIQEDFYFVILNLINNAIEAVRKNGFKEIEFNFNVQVISKLLTVSVLNTNSSMDNNQINKFLGNKKRLEFGRRGNGSYIIFKSVENNNGTIDIQSYDNKVEFIIIFKDVESKILDESQENRLEGINKKEIHEKLKIVVLDDELLNLNEWRKILEGNEFVSYTDPEKFFEDIIFNKIKINDFDLIISDYLFKSRNSNNILTADSLKIGYQLRKRFGYKGALFLSSSISHKDYDNKNMNNEDNYFDYNIENKFLSINEIRAILLKTG